MEPDGARVSRQPVRPPTIRTTGGPNPQRHGSHLCRSANDLRRVERARKSVSPLSARPGRRPRHSGGISLERSLELAIGLLGILKAGAAYVPLDPTFPKD